MLLKALFIAILIYFAYVAIRNLIHAVRVDSMARPRMEQRRDLFQEVLRERERERRFRQRSTQPRRPPEPHVQQRPEARSDPEEDVQDARWTDL